MIKSILKKSLCLFIFSAAIEANAQTTFQNYYGSEIFKDETFAASPDAYYLLHFVTQPSLTSKLIKVDMNGNLRWTKQINYAAMPMEAMRITYHNNSLLITGYNQNPNYVNFILKLDTAGNVLWSTDIDYGDINISARIHPNVGGYMLSGFRDYIGAQPDYTYDVTLSQIDNNGSLLWAKAYGDNNYDFVCNASTIAPNGDIMIAGNYGSRITNVYQPMLARFNSTGNLLWMETIADTTGFYTKLSPNDITNTSDGNFAIVATSFNTNTNYDAQVIKFDSTGTILWGTRIYQVPWHEFGKSIINDSNGDLIISGSYDYTPEYGDFAARVNSAGVLINAAKTSNTTFDSWGTQGAVYSIRGGNLAEVPGFGYAGSTRYHLSSGDERHCLIVTDNLGVIDCNALGGTYNCAWQVSNWTPTLFTSLPVAQTNITDSSVTYTISSLTETSGDICPVGIDENNFESAFLSIYPNPASEIVMVKFYGDINDATITVTDITGKEIKVVINISGSESTIDVSEFSSGVYFISVTQENKLPLIDKLIISK